MSDNEMHDQQPAADAAVQNPEVAATGTGTARSWFDQNRRTVLIGGAVAIIVIAAIVSFASGGDDNKSNNNSSGGANVGTATEVSVSAEGLRAAVGAVGGTGKVFWVGEETGFTYVFRSEPTGRTSVRYIPADGDPATQGPVYRVLGNYPMKNAFQVTKQAGQTPGAVLLTNADGSIVVYDENKTTNVYIAFPDVDVQVEIFDPTPGKALELATTGRVIKVA